MVSTLANFLNATNSYTFTASLFPFTRTTSMGRVMKLWGWSCDWVDSDIKMDEW